MEVGRVNKTLYLLNYIDDEDYRRRILTQLNRGEGRHAVGRGRSATGSAVRSESAIVKVRKISWGHWAWSLTQWYCGTHLLSRKTSRWIRSNGEEIGVEEYRPVVPTDARAYQYAGALYVYATGGYFEGGTERTKFQFKQ